MHIKNTKNQDLKISFSFFFSTIFQLLDIETRWKHFDQKTAHSKNTSAHSTKLVILLLLIILMQTIIHFSLTLSLYRIRMRFCC